MNVYVCTICRAEGMNAKENVCAARRDLLVRQIGPLVERIAVLEAKDEELYGYITEKPSIGQFLELSERIKTMEAYHDVAPPPAPEEDWPDLNKTPPEQAQETDIARAWGDWNGRSDPPEQAQETWPCQCKCGCKVTRTKAEGGKTFTVCDACWNGHAPPEQARRTFTNVSFVSHQKAPPRAEGVRVWRSSKTGKVLFIDGSMPVPDGTTEYGTYYPDAPPRAEEE